MLERERHLANAERIRAALAIHNSMVGAGSRRGVLLPVPPEANFVFRNNNSNNNNGARRSFKPGGFVHPQPEPEENNNNNTKTTTHFRFEANACHVTTGSGHVFAPVALAPPFAAAPPRERSNPIRRTPPSSHPSFKGHSGVSQLRNSSTDHVTDSRPERWMNLGASPVFVSGLSRPPSGLSCKTKDNDNNNKQLSATSKLFKFSVEYLLTK